MTAATVPARLRTGDLTWTYDPYWDAYRCDDPEIGVLRTREQLDDIYDGQVSEL